MIEPESTHIEVRGCDGRVFDALPILRHVTIRGISGFCIHRYFTDDGIDEYRVSHLETGAYLCRAATDGEVFVIARRFTKEELEHKIIRTRRELDRLKELQDNNGKRVGE